MSCRRSGVHLFWGYAVALAIGVLSASGCSRTPEAPLSVPLADSVITKFECIVGEQSWNDEDELSFPANAILETKGEFVSTKESYAVGGTVEKSHVSGVPHGSEHIFPMISYVFLKKASTPAGYEPDAMGMLQAEVLSDGRQVRMAGVIKVPKTPGRYALCLGVTHPVEHDENGTQFAPVKFIAQRSIKVE